MSGTVHVAALRARKRRTRHIQLTWGAVWLALAATLLRPSLAPVLLAACAANLLLFLAIERGGVRTFAVQVRVAFLVWAAAGALVPTLWPLLYVPLIGIPARIVTGYCLLARIVSLLPWNRSVPLSAALLHATFFSPPRPGPFSAGPRPSASE